MEVPSDLRRRCSVRGWSEKTSATCFSVPRPVTSNVRNARLTSSTGPSSFDPSHSDSRSVLAVAIGGDHHGPSAIATRIDHPDAGRSDQPERGVRVETTEPPYCGRSRSHEHSVKSEAAPRPPGHAGDVMQMSPCRQPGAMSPPYTRVHRPRAGASGLEPALACCSGCCSDGLEHPGGRAALEGGRG